MKDELAKRRAAAKRKIAIGAVVFPACILAIAYYPDRALGWPWDLVMLVVLIVLSFRMGMRQLIRGGGELVCLNRLKSGGVAIGERGPDQ